MSATQEVRVGIIGTTLQYPFFGLDLSNHVQFVGEEIEHHGYQTMKTCADWRRAVNDGEYTYLVLADPSFPYLFRPAQEHEWTIAGDAARVVMREKEVSLIALDGRLDPDGCPPTAT